MRAVSNTGLVHPPLLDHLEGIAHLIAGKSLGRAPHVPSFTKALVSVRVHRSIVQREWTRTAIVLSTHDVTHVEVVHFDGVIVVYQKIFQLEISVHYGPSRSVVQSLQSVCRIERHLHHLPYFHCAVPTIPHSMLHVPGKVFRDYRVVARPYEPHDVLTVLHLFLGKNISTKSRVRIAVVHAFKWHALRCPWTEYTRSNRGSPKARLVLIVIVFQEKGI